MADADPESSDTNFAEDPLELARAFDALEFPEHKALTVVGARGGFDFARFACWMKVSDSATSSATESLQNFARTHEPISRGALNRLYFAERVFQGWQQQLLLDRQLHEVLRQWQGGLMASIAANVEALAEQSEHPLRRLLRVVERHSQGWYEGLGRAGRDWLEHLQALGSAFAAGSMIDPKELWARFEETQRLLEKESGRVQVLEKRLREAESGADRVWYYRELVHQRLNGLFRQFQLPPSVADFIVGPWRDSMQLLLLEEGAQGENWTRHAKLVETLVWSMQEHTDPQARQRLYPVAARLVDELAKGLVTFKHNPQEMEPWLESVQALLMQRVKGEPVSLAPVAELPQQAGFSLRTDLSTDQGYGLVGNWYLHQDSGVRQKCLAYLPYQEAVVWVNYLGRKLSLQAWSEVSVELKNQVLQPFRAQTVFDEMLTGTVQRFLNIHALQDKQRQTARQREEARERQQEEARALARRKAEAEAARIQKEQEAAAKRYEEARRLAREEAARAQQEAETTRRLELRRSAQDALDRMTLGGWIELLDGDERRRGKLAVRINASDKLVFVDRLGLRIGDFKRDELVDRIVAGTVRIVDEGRDFDQRLARVVGTIRGGGGRGPGA